MATVKIKLGEKPTHIQKNVRFPLDEKREGAIEWCFKYRTRREYGEFVDSVVATNRARALAHEEAEKKKADEMAAAGEKQDDKPFSMADLMAKTAEATVDYILQIADGWDLGPAFDRENLEQLADECPAATAAAIDAYRAAMSEGRLGN